MLKTISKYDIEDCTVSIKKGRSTDTSFYDEVLHVRSGGLRNDTS